MVPRKVVILGTTSEAMTLAQALMRPGFEVTLIESDESAGERAQFYLTRLQSELAQNVPVPTVTNTHHPLDTADIVFEALEGDAQQRSDVLSRLNFPDQAP